MKRLATVCLLLLTGLLSNRAAAQSTNATPVFVPSQGSGQPAGVYHTSPLPVHGLVLQGVHVPLAIEDTIAYFTTDNNGATAWPLGDTVKDAQGAPSLNPNGVPYIRLMALERFTMPEVQPMIDSVRFIFVADTLMGGTSSKLQLTFLYQKVGQLGDGTDYPFPSLSAPAMRSMTINATKINLHQVVDTTIRLRPAVKVDMSDTLQQNKGNVFVGLNSYTQGNMLRMIADSNVESARSLDEQVDRAYWLGLSTDNAYYTTGVWAGYYADPQNHSDDAVLYPNFLMFVYSHEGQAGLVSQGSTDGFKLGQNYPNSFATKTTIRFGLDKSQPVSLKVYNAMGEEVGSAYDGVAGSGTHEVTFDGSNLPNGTYFYTLRSPGQSITRSMTVAR